MKQRYVAASCSGGKDSVAMVLRCFDEGEHIDEIIFCDVMEWPEAKATVKDLADYTGIPLSVLTAPHPFEWYLAEKPVTRGKHAGRLGYGWPTPKNRWCTSNMKARVVDAHLKRLREEYDLIQMIGIAADEKTRSDGSSGSTHTGSTLDYPLQRYGMRTVDNLEYCEEHGFDFGGLYEEVERLSCWCCPLQSLGQLRNLHDNHPDLWAELKRLDSRAYNSFRYDYTLDELEQLYVNDSYDLVMLDWAEAAAGCTGNCPNCRGLCR